MYSAFNNNTVLLLCSHDAGITPLHEAAFKGDEKLCSAHLREGAHVVPKNSYLGETPLHLAARNGHAGVISLILTESSRVAETHWLKDIAHCSNDEGRTPLHVAAANGQVQVCSLILHGLVRVDEKDNIGDTSLHEAVRNGHMFWRRSNCNGNNVGCTPLLHWTILNTS